MSFPAFHHENDAVNNYITRLLTSPDIKDGPQLILMAGIVLSNVELIKYSCNLDPKIINMPVPNYILEATDAVLSSVTNKTLSEKIPKNPG